MAKLVRHGVVNLLVLGGTAAIWGCGGDPTAWQQAPDEGSVGEVQQSVVSGNWLVATGAAGLNTVTADSWLGTDSASNYAVEIRVKGARALRLEPVSFATGAPNVLGGHQDNVAQSGVHTSVVAGGGVGNGGGNVLWDNYTTIAGGAFNSAGNLNADRTDAQGATISGGNNSRARGAWSTIGGGYNNETNAMGATVNGGMDGLATGTFGTVGGGSVGVASGGFSTVAGGQSNSASGQHASVGGGFNNTSSGASATVAGGYQGQATKDYAAVGGGLQNKAIGPYAAVGGGSGNQAGSTTSATITYATVGGGNLNIASSYNATVAGGYSNEATAEHATVSGGSNNTASGIAAVAAGGEDNVASGAHSFVSGAANLASGAKSFVGGGSSNQATNIGSAVLGGASNSAIGLRSVAIGGTGNQASGVASFAAGTNAFANFDNCFVWSDGSAPASCIANNMFVVRALNGVVFQTVGGSGVRLFPGGGSFDNLSDRNAKTEIAPLDAVEVLERVRELPMNTWSYKTELGVRHMGPMAQDFRAAFGLGASERSINTVDADGVALAAIQGLDRKVRALEAEAASLKESLAKQTAVHREELATLAAQNRDLAKRLERLEAAWPAKAGFSGDDSRTSALLAAAGGLAFVIARRRSVQPARRAG